MRKEIFDALYGEKFKERITHLREEQKRLSELLSTVKSPGFQIIRDRLNNLRIDATKQVLLKGNAGVLTIWFKLEAIWRGQQTIEDIDNFLDWIDSTGQQLTETSQELAELLK